MRKRAIIAGCLSLGLAFSVAVAQEWKSIMEVLLGFEEVPAVSTSGHGEFKARISKDETEIEYELTYADLEGTVQQAHIHLGQPRVNGGISVWLCSNLASPPTPSGTQPCPPPPATITGTITTANVVGPVAQGIAPGEFGELIHAIRAGSTYVNVHTSKFTGGEIRSQIDHGNGDEHGTRK